MTPDSCGPSTVGDDVTQAITRGSMPTLGRGEQVDRYVILAEVGAGGMGVVYAAYDPELDRKVAIKVLKDDNEPGTEGPSNGSLAGRGRALREAQALAKLSHPNVLPIYDVGMVQGSVFLATQFVDGSTLDEWLRSRRRPWKQVVDVFVNAGRGLAAAHAEGLVHRDFKPANVMISKSGDVRVTDFGLVRRDIEVDDAPRTTETYESASESGNPLDSHLTQAGVVLGTPAYMAPEQQLGTTVDARADQYSFCVALYEGLYGCLPFRQDPGAMMAAKYSLTISSLPKGSEGRTPRWLRAIVVRGLSPRPDDRWPSMDALLAALSRPPLSRSPTAWGAATAVLVASLGAGFWHARAEAPGSRCNGAVDRVASAWNASRTQRLGEIFLARDRSRAEAVRRLVSANSSARMEGLGEALQVSPTWDRVRRRLDAYTIAWSAEHRDACEATRVRQDQSVAMMDLRMACLQQRFWELEALLDLLEKGDPDVLDNALVATADLRPLEQCRDLAALQTGATAPATEALKATADRLDKASARAKALTDAGRFQEAKDVLDPLVGEAEGLDYPPSLVRLLAQRGVLESRSGDYRKAKETLARTVSLAMAHRMFGVAAEAQVSMLYVVGYGLGQPDEALLLAEYAQGTVTAAGDRKDLLGQIKMNQGIAWYRKGEAEKAFELMAEASRLVGDYLGEDHPQMVASLSNLSAIAGLLERNDEAIVYAHQAVSIGEAHLPPESQALGYSLMNLGILQAEAADYEKAESSLGRALRIFETSAGSSNPQVANALAAWGQLRKIQGRYDEAAGYMEDAIAMLHKVQAAQGHVYSGALAILGEIREGQGRFEDAFAAYDEVLRISEEVAPRSDEHMKAFTLRGRALLRLGRDREALVSLEQALALGEEVDTRASNLAESRFLTAQALVRLDGDRQRAVTLAGHAAETWKAVDTALARRHLVEVKRWLERHNRF